MKRRKKSKSRRFKRARIGTNRFVVFAGTKRDTLRVVGKSKTLSQAKKIALRQKTRKLAIAQINEAYEV